MSEAGTETAGVEAIDDLAVVNAILEELAGLDPVEYDRRRQREADRLNIRVATLDSEVAKRRPDGDDDTAAGVAVVFKDIEPWPEAVDGVVEAPLLRSAERPHRFQPGIVPRGVEQLRNPAGFRRGP